MFQPVPGPILNDWILTNVTQNVKESRIARFTCCVPQVFDEWSAETDPSFNEVDQLDTGSDERWQLHPSKKENYYDLHGDTKVNDYFSDRAQNQGLVMIEPDAELVDADQNSYYRYESLPQRIQQFP